MTTDSNRPDVAVFIDFENVYVSVRDKLDANPNFESIMDRCEDLGRVVIARAYADWYRYPRITSALYANAIEPMYVPTYHYDRELGRTGRAIKNSVDMNLCVDAMRTLYTNTNIAKFVLATGDRDFIPLVNSIRQQGKEVIVIGIGGAASAHLAQSADEFIFYESLIGKPASQLLPDQPRARMPEKGRENEAEIDSDVVPERRERERGREREREQRSTERYSDRNGEQRSAEQRNGEQRSAEQRNGEPRNVERNVDQRETERNGDQNIYDVLVQAVKLARERGYVCSFGSLKLLMKELMGGEFKEGRYKDAQGRPFAKFKDFVMEGERRGKVQVFTNGTVNEVFLPGENPLEVSQFAGDLREDAAPQLPIVDTSPERRSESREGLNNGRRRRRRPRGGRQDNTPITAASDDLLEPELIDDLEDLSDEQVELDLNDSAESDALFDSLLEQVEQEQQETDSISMFNALEFDDEPFDGVAIDELIENPVIDEPVARADDEQPAIEQALAFDGSEAEPSGPVIEPVALIGRPFDEEDWRVLRAVVARFERPVSFVQIHDALRDARNRNESTRTNEELRTLVKQAINTGILERTGKGNRIAYILAQPAVTDEEAPAEAETQSEQPEAELDQTTLFAPSTEDTVAPETVPLNDNAQALIEQAAEGAAEAEGTSPDQLLGEAALDQTALIEQAAEGAAETEGTSPEQLLDTATTEQTAIVEQAAEGAAETEGTSPEQLLDAATPDQTTLIEQAADATVETPASAEEAPAAEPDAHEASAVPNQATLIEQGPQDSVPEESVAEAAPTEAAPAAPKRQRRRKAAPAEATETAAPVAEAAPAAEEAPKPRRRTRKPKAEPTETQE